MFEFFQEWTIYQILTFTFLVITSILTISLSLRTLYNWYKKRKEKKEYNKLMEDPLEVHFFIPPLKQHKITYEKQNSVHTIGPKYELEMRARAAAESQGEADRKGEAIPSLGCILVL